MVQRIPAQERGALWPLFGDTQETMVWSCLQGRMGEVLADRGENAACALALLGDFGFFGGDACSIPPAFATAALIPQNSVSCEVLGYINI